MKGSSEESQIGERRTKNLSVVKLRGESFLMCKQGDKIFFKNNLKKAAEDLTILRDVGGSSN